LLFRIIIRVELKPNESGFIGKGGYSVQLKYQPRVKRKMGRFNLAICRRENQKPLLDFVESVLLIVGWAKNGDVYSSI
jgi:hypothetical protein